MSLSSNFCVAQSKSWLKAIACEASRLILEMYSLSIKEAETQLAKLTEDAVRGEDVIITCRNGTSFRIVPVTPETRKPKFDSAKGLNKTSDDFDEPIEGFEGYC